MICAIMQPTFLPWLGFFDMIDQVDAFVLYDDVQLAKRSWQVRNRIKTAQGELFLTVPVRKTGHRDDATIASTPIDYSQDWIRKHLAGFQAAYRKAAFFDEVYPVLEDLYQRRCEHLGTFTSEGIRTISSRMGIDSEIVTASRLDDIQGRKDARLAAVCRRIGADEYLSARGSAPYIEAETPGGRIVENAIALYYHNYEHPEYRQLHGGFQPFMAIVDLLFNEGFANALEIIRHGRREKIGYLRFREEFLNRA